MPDMWVGQIDDPLPGPLQLIRAGIDYRDPAQCLMRRGDVVAIGGKDHQGIADPPQVNVAPFADLHQPLLKTVAYEQVLDNGDDLLPAQEVEAVPSALELQEPLALGFDVGEQVGVFLPDTLRFEVFEILHEPSAVEASAAEVGQQVNEPSAADEATSDAHWIETCFPGPVR